MAVVVMFCITMIELANAYCFDTPPIYPRWLMFIVQFIPYVYLIRCLIKLLSEFPGFFERDEHIFVRVAV